MNWEKLVCIKSARYFSFGKKHNSKSSNIELKFLIKDNLMSEQNIFLFTNKFVKAPESSAENGMDLL